MPKLFITRRVIYVRLEDGSKACLVYETREGRMELLKTHVPSSFRGEDWLGRWWRKRSRWLKSEPICSYAIYYFLENLGKRELLPDEYQETNLEDLWRGKVEEERRKGIG